MKLPWPASLLAGLLVLGSLPAGTTQSPSPSVLSSRVDEALSAALRGTPAVALVLDARTGRLLAAHRSEQAAMLSSAPGSILKPLFLAGALERHEVHPETTVFCRRSLHIPEGNQEGAVDRNLACTHPQNDVAFDAEEALAYSCNTYFAALANRIPLDEAAAILAAYGLGELPHLFPAEASGLLLHPRNSQQKQLLVLGLEGIAVTPAQVAIAYRRLALELSNAQAPPVLRTVSLGLRDSVDHGMAHNADVPGMGISGKTGTASDPGQAWSHGWFAGTGSTGPAECAIVIYLPHGSGADAARLAQHFFLALRDARKP